MKPKNPPAPPVTITRDEWAEAFREAVAKSTGAGHGDPGLTREELREALGVSITTLIAIMRRWHRDGRLIAGRQLRPGYSIDGRASWVPVYRIK